MSYPTLLATWGEQRTHDFKDVPTLKDLGYGVVVDAPNGVGAPRGLDPAIAMRLREAELIERLKLRELLAKGR